MCTIMTLMLTRCGPRPVTVFHRPPLYVLSKLWSSHLFKHNEAAIELQIEPSSTNKQIRDTMVTTMFNHFLAPEGGQPTLEKNFIDFFFTKMQGPFF